MIKIIVNRCYGGWGLSNEAFEWLIKNKGWKVSEYLEDGKTLKYKNAKLTLTSNPEFHGKYWAIQDTDVLRVDADVIECVETLKEKASGECGGLEIVKIPNGVKWEVDEYDGMETIHEVHRSW